ncbi:transcription factor E2F6 [Melanotaenia boesemani]|uniref:transcription factor E2F6 n=1 Tax=Melanotaenia boesemani TaxID=1250792 RepID=UPI001C05ED4A|nr:transcription factor E2F6 [Melanotaenia boesemani]
MVKCVVSGCPNRVATVNRGTFNRAPKRFFNFPKDPARVKVWLAALRETDKQDTSEQHLICEDHFLPEDISTNGVNGDAIPLMPPCLDGPMDAICSWEAESSGDEDQWAATGGREDFEDESGGRIPFNTKLSVPEIPSLDPPEQVPAAGPALGDKTRKHQWRAEPPASMRAREDVSLGVLTRRFLGLFLKTPDGSLDVRTAIASLQTRRRRLYDITNVLEGIRLLDKKSANVVQWIGRCPASSFLEKNESQGEMDNLKLVEDTLDSLIKSCAQKLFDMTDNLQNAALAYVTHDDISRLKSFQEQTVIAVKAPEETRLEVPAPKEDSIQVHLKGGKGPILVMTCDVGRKEVMGEKSSCFVSLEESRIKTTPLRPESLQSA